jgi:hypothetical protein
MENAVATTNRRRCGRGCSCGCRKEGTEVAGLLLLFLLRNNGFENL